MLRVTDLTKRYKTRRGAATVLDGISFGLRKGENLGIVGRNGAGKSTLIRLLSGAEEPSSGRIRPRDVGLLAAGVYRSVPAESDRPRQPEIRLPRPWG